MNEVADWLNSLTDLQLSLLIGGILGIIPAFIAYRKGRSFFRWYIFGVLAIPIAIVFSLIAKRDKATLEQRALGHGELVRCPSCAEPIRKEAKICRFCQTPVHEAR